MNDEQLTILLDSVTDAQKERLAASVLAGIRRTLAQPGGEEFLRKSYENYCKGLKEKESGYATQALS